ncbi:MAG: Ig-like domain-containing protein, partial [Methanobrevibacter sp.]|nr:Ig-like domain-containing protein [Methanobrevibacter sp.]
IVIDEDLQVTQDDELELTQKDNLSATYAVKGSSFEDIQNKINSASSGDIVTLSGNYSGSGSHIKIDKSLTIEGNGATLDAKGLSKIFEITGKGVAINNINFKNGHSASAGAIDWWGGGSNGLLTNCNFINCTANFNAGAVYFCDNSLTMYNCKFYDNSAFKGGAVYVSGDNCIVESCEFYSNLININPGSSILAAGAAICCEGENIVIDNCIFAYNDVNGEISYNYNYLDDFEDKYGMGIRIMDNNNNLSNILISNSIFNNALTFYLFYSNNPDNTYINNYSSNILSNNRYYLAYDTCSFNNESYGGIGISENYSDVKFTKTSISVPNMTYEKGKSVNIAASIKTDNGAEVTQGKVLFSVNGKYYISNVENGKASITLILDDSKNVINCFAIYIPGFSTETFYGKSMTNFNVMMKSTTELIASKVTATYGVSKNLVVTLKDGNGNILKSKKVTINVGTISKTLTTNDKGQVSVNIASLVPKTYTAAISFAGDDNYIKSSTTANVIVKKATPKLTAKAKTFKKSVKTKKYIVTLKNNKNKALNKVKLSLTVKGKTYYATTNKYGKATFKITKLTKKGKHTATIKFKGSKYYNAKTAKPKITIK